MPIAVGAVLSTLFIPVSNWLEKRIRMPRWLSVFFCLSSVLVFLSGVLALVGWQISGLAGDFEQMKILITEWLVKASAYLYEQFGLSPEQQADLINKQQSKLTSLIQGIASSLTDVVSTSALILVFFVFLLYYRGHIKKFILMVADEEDRQDAERVLYTVSRVSNQYLLGLMKMIALLWVMYGIGFSLLGVKSALFFAVLCGLLEVVPYLGNLIGTSITLLIAFVNGASWMALLGIAGVYGIVQFVQGWVLEPLIVGAQVKVNPLATILALLIGEFVWGISGVFLAIPVIAMLKIICDNVENLKPYGVLIGVTESSKSARKKRDLPAEEPSS